MYSRIVLEHTIISIYSFLHNHVLRIDNSGRSMICGIAHISETIKGIIKCDISNDWANYSLFFI